MTDFATFWAAFPRRKTTPTIMGRLAAQQKAERIVKSGMATWEDLIEGAKKYAQCDSVAEGFICMPMTWLNQGRWLDEYEVLEGEREKLFRQMRGKLKPVLSDDEWRLLLGNVCEFTRDYTIREHADWLSHMSATIKREYGFLKAVAE